MNFNANFDANHFLNCRGCPGNVSDVALSGGQSSAYTHLSVPLLQHPLLHLSLLQSPLSASSGPPPPPEDRPCSELQSLRGCMDAAAGDKQRAGDKRKSALLCSVTLQMEMKSAPPLPAAAEIIASI